MMAPLQQQMGTGTSNLGGLQGTIFPQSTGLSNAGSASGSGSASREIGPPAPAAGSSAANFFSQNENADLRTSLVSSQTTLASLETSQTTLTASLASLTSERAELEASLASTTSAISTLQSQLAVSRTAYLAEQAMLKDLSERSSKQKDLLDRARHELITAESDLSALRVERNEIEGSYLRDKEETRELRKKSALVEEERKKLGEEVEKLGKERRREKGLGAIAKKMLGGSVAEKEKLEKELEALKLGGGEGVEDVVEGGEGGEGTREIGSVPAPALLDDLLEQPFDMPTPATTLASQGFAATSLAAATSLPLPGSNLVSPALSVRSTNPFERLAASSAAASPLPSVVAPPAVASYASIAALGALAAEDSEHDKPVEIKEEEPEIDPFGLPTGRTPPVDVKGKGKEVVESTSFEDAFEDDFGKATIVAPAVEEEQDVFSAEKEEEAVTPFGGDEEVVEETKVEEDKVTPAVVVPKEEEEEDSSDDDEGPEQVEEAAPSHLAREGALSDSGDSFVHVSPPSVAAAGLVGESEFPPIEDLEETLPVTTREGSSTAVAAISEAPLEVSIPPPSPNSAISAVSTPATKKRAAPPPPPGRSPSILVPAVTSSAASKHVPSEPPTDDFDDSAFDDLPPPAPVVPGATPTSKTVIDDEFDDAFETDFAFQPAFAPAPASASVSRSASGNTAFDDSFANFDAAFDPIVPASPVPVGTSAFSAAAGAFSFDDAFGNDSFSAPPAVVKAPAASAAGDAVPGYLEARPVPPPNVPARPAVTPALENDVPGVKTLTDMGFSRTQALEALQKYDVSASWSRRVCVLLLLTASLPSMILV